MRTFACKKPNRRDAELIRRTLHRHLTELRQRYKVVSLSMFGSYVRDEQRPRSDLDLLVEFDDESLGLLKFIEMENYE